jgi:hypothetical protein
LSRGPPNRVLLRGVRSSNPENLSLPKWNQTFFEGPVFEHQTEPSVLDSHKALFDATARDARKDSLDHTHRPALARS